VSIAGQPAGVEEARARIRVSSLRNAQQKAELPLPAVCSNLQSGVMFTGSSCHGNY